MSLVLEKTLGTAPPKGHSSPPFSAHVYCGQTTPWIKMPVGTKVGLGPGDTVLDGDPAPPKGEQQPPPIFGSCLLLPNGRPSQQLLSSCFFTDLILFHSTSIVVEWKETRRARQQKSSAGLIVSSFVTRLLSKGSFMPAVHCQYSAMLYLQNGYCTKWLF